MFDLAWSIHREYRPNKMRHTLTTLSYHCKFQGVPHATHSFLIKASKKLSWAKRKHFHLFTKDWHEVTMEVFAQVLVWWQEAEALVQAFAFPYASTRTPWHEMTSQPCSKTAHRIDHNTIFHPCACEYASSGILALCIWFCSGDIQTDSLSDVPFSHA